ncbi:MAG: DUF63 family protein, partial [Archaeoglobaceae archaeon]
EGYNVVNTITWAVILVVTVFLLYRYLEKRFEINWKFIFATMPYIILGSASRVVEDAGFLSPPVSYVFMSPFIFFLIFLLAFPSLLISRRFFGANYYKVYAAIGLVCAISTLLLLFLNLRIENPLVLPYGIIFALSITSVFSLIPKTRNLLSLAVLFAHMLDGFESYLGIQYHNYVEIHVIPNLLVDKFGAVSLPVVKFIAISSILYLIDSSNEKENLKNFIKLVLLVFGLAPALRNGLRIMFGV